MKISERILDKRIREYARLVKNFGTSVATHLRGYPSRNTVRSITLFSLHSCVGVNLGGTLLPLPFVLACHTGHETVIRDTQRQAPYMLFYADDVLLASSKTYLQQLVRNGITA